MNRTAQRRLESLEIRQPKNPFALMSQDEVTRYCDDVFDRLVQTLGLDEAKAGIRELATPEQIEHLGFLKAIRAIRDE